MSPEITVLLSLLSSVIGALITHYLTSRRKKHSKLSEFRIKAYIDFINAATKLVTARLKGNIEDKIDELVAPNDAKTQICICADEKYSKN